MNRRFKSSALYLFVPLFFGLLTVDASAVAPPSQPVDATGIQYVPPSAYTPAHYCCVSSIIFQVFDKNANFLYTSSEFSCDPSYTQDGGGQSWCPKNTIPVRLDISKRSDQGYNMWVCYFRCAMPLVTQTCGWYANCNTTAKLDGTVTPASNYQGKTGTDTTNKYNTGINGPTALP